MVKTFLYLDTFLLVTITIYKKMILKNSFMLLGIDSFKNCDALHVSLGELHK